MAGCRIAKLELVDEIEELELVLGHYAITWATKAEGDADRILRYPSWGLTRKK